MQDVYFEVQATQWLVLARDQQQRCEWNLRNRFLQGGYKREEKGSVGRTHRKVAGDAQE